MWATFENAFVNIGIFQKCGIESAPWTFTMNEENVK
jgi:hypothetical protein